MARLRKITYFVKGKKKFIEVKVCDTIISKFLGLMFKKKSPVLFFVFDREKNLSIHSFFCRPFKAIWLDKDFNSTKSIEIRRWRPNFSGRGKYLLEIPL